MPHKVESSRSSSPGGRKSARRKRMLDECRQPSARIFSVEIDGEKNGLGFSAAHFIAGHNPCGRLHGHNFCVKALVEGAPDGSGMVVDFFAIEGAIRDLLADMDHKILVARRHAVIDAGIVRFMTSDGEVGVSKNAIVLLDIRETTSELLADYILTHVVFDSGLDFGSVTSFAVGVGESGGRIGWSKILLNR